MKTILVATDFSERSDRAIRRAQLLAHEFESRIQLVHVVDDDQAPRIVQAERFASTELLEEMARSLDKVDGIKCGFRVVLGQPFLGITQAARELDADLIVIGPHRRQILRDILIGTTAERTIRNSDRPVLMANGVPTSPYRRVLVTTDLSPHSEATFRTAQALGLFNRPSVSLMYGFSAPGAALMSRESFRKEEQEAYIAGERRRAVDEVASFIARVSAEEILTILKPITVNIPETIFETARERPPDLIVLGTCRRSVFGRVLMGSVAEEVLRVAECDVLAIPPRNEAES